MDHLKQIFIQYVTLGDLESIKYLVYNGFDATFDDNHALIVAYANEQHEIVKYLESLKNV